jgi:hypothetical protein
VIIESPPPAPEKHKSIPSITCDASKALGTGNEQLTLQLERSGQGRQAMREKKTRILFGKEPRGSAAHEIKRNPPLLMNTASRAGPGNYRASSRGTSGMPSASAIDVSYRITPVASSWQRPP